MGFLLGILVLGGAAVLPAQQPKPSITGIVRAGDAATPVAGAEVIIGDRKTTTNDQGTFRIESLAPGQHSLTVRLIGYRPLRARVSVLADRPTELNLRLDPMPVVLPTLIAEAPRPGIYGVVVDSALHPLRDSKVAVLGFMGAEALTDSLGAFAFPKANAGTYMIHVSKPGFGSRRITVEIQKGRGREVSFRLAPSSEEQAYPREAEALWEQRRRLAMNASNTRMTRSEMDKFGSMRLCDVPKLNIRAGDPTTVILNGVSVLREASLCTWRMNEVELVEFCDFGGCPNPDAPRPLLDPSAGRAKRRWAVMIWEKQEQSPAPQ